MSTTQKSLWDEKSESNWLNFTEARDFVRTLELKSEKGWGLYLSKQFPELIQLPRNIPDNPDLIYRHLGWLSWDDWLGLEESDNNIDDPEVNNETQECRCKGLLKDCPVCDGKGYYFKKRPNL